MIPSGTHTDWPWVFSRIPRAWNAIDYEVEPVKICGNTEPGEHLDVPQPGHWVIAGFGRVKVPVHFACQTKGRRYLRLSLLRFNYAENERYYSVCSFGYKNYSR